MRGLAFNLLAAQGGNGADEAIVEVLGLAVIAGYVAGHWKTFVKAGKPGWAALVPIYNVVHLLDIAGRPIWWFFLFLIPGVNIGVGAIVGIDIASHFGKGAGFGLGLAFLGFVFFPILGFGCARYRPPP